MSRRRVWLAVFLAIAGCSSSGSKPDGGPDGAQDSCAPFYPGTLTTSTIHGTGFDQCEGQAVWACLLPAQSFGMGCGAARITGGQFSVSASVCTGINWTVIIGGGDQITCSTGAGDDVEVTPLTCPCPAADAGASDGAGDR